MFDLPDPDLRHDGPPLPQTDLFAPSGPLAAPHDICPWATPTRG